MSDIDDKQLQMNALQALLDPAYREAGLDAPLSAPNDQPPIPLRAQPSEDDDSASSTPEPVAPKVAAPPTSPASSTPSLDDEIANALPAQPSAQQPSVMDYLKQKYFGAGLSDDAIKAAQQKANDQIDSTRPWQFLAGFGNAIAGRDSSDTDKYFAQQRANILDQNVGTLQRQKAGVMQDLQANNAFQQSDNEQQKNDPTSKQSQLVQGMVAKLYPGKFTPEQLGSLTAANADSIYKPLELDEKMKENSANMAMKNEIMKQGQQDRKDRKSGEAYTQMRKDMESFRGNAGARQASLDVLASQKALKLVEGKDPNKLSTQDLQLLADEMGKIATGGIPGEHGVQALLPNNLQTKFAEMKNFLLSKPSDAQAGEYIKKNMSYLKDMQGVAGKTLNDYRGNIAKGYRNRVSPEDYAEAQKDYGLDQPSTPEAAPTDHASGAAAELAKRGVK